MSDEESRDKYWEGVTKNLDYFRTTDLSIVNSKKNRKFLMLLETVSDSGRFLDYAKRTLEDGYEPICRYWLNLIVVEHVDFIWRSVYEDLRRAHSIDSDTAMTVADQVKKGYVREMKELWP